MGEKTQGGITMPNKDSFTFSDKLRKSKSVPLSKRLPSIVGGQNKQKRTLVQRAQRDLPFILVAALALLLLPFLSRTGSDDIAGTGDFAWNSMADAPSFAEGGSADIMPAGAMDDPMKWILTNRSDVQESGATMGTDANKSAYGSSSSGSGYGDDGSSSSGYSSRYSSKRTGTSSSSPDYNQRKSYDEQYTTRKTTKKPATSTYAKTTRPSVRKSFERKGTEINKALRISQMPGNKGSTGVGHALPLGQGPTKTPGTAFREGIRPVALQRMESHGGVGRGTEGLRAEADRSIREMNAGGPAKANLLAAQMRDIDGKPVGDGPGFGGPGAGGAASRLPGGGGPNNQNGYSVQKPWWWDMMQARSQKMWDLLYYKPREIWYNNMYNYASQLMNCLFTGNKDGDVSTMFGQGAADSDWMCVRNGKEVMPRYNKQKTHKTKDKDGNTTEETVDSSWVNECINIARGEIIEKKKDAKSFLDVRLECVGLDVVVDWLRAITKHTKYDKHCEGVNNDPMKFTLDIERSNDRERHNTRREKRLKEKSVIVLLAKVQEGPYKGKELVVYAEQGNSLSEAGSDFARGFAEAHGNCELSRLVAFVSRKGSLKVEERISRYNADDQARQSTVRLLSTDDEDETHLSASNEDGIMMPSFSVIPEQGQVTAANLICQGQKSNAKPLTLDEIRNMSELGKGKKNSYAECEIWGKKPIFSRKAINDSVCHNCCEIGVDIKKRTTFSATIANSKDKQVQAVVVEQIDGETKAKVIYVANFDAGGTLGRKWCVDGTNTCTYSFTINVASLGFNPNEIGTKVRTDYPGGSSSRSSSNNAGQRERTSADVTSVNSTLSTSIATQQAECTKRGDDLAAARAANASAEQLAQLQAAYNECQNTLRSLSGGLTVGSYQGDSDSSSDGSNLSTARGSGRIFWIVTKPGATLKVDMWQDVAKTLDEIYVSDLVDTNGPVMWDLCRYRWCNDVATCDLPKDLTNVCKAEDGRFYLYETIELDGKIFNLPLDLLPDYKANGGEPDCDKFCKDKDDKGEDIITCPHRIIKLKEAMDLFPPGFIPKIPLCAPYCQYKGKVYDAMYVEETGEYYITNAEVRNLKGEYPECTPLAWSWRTGTNDFYVYRFMGEYNDTELPLTPNSLDSALKCTLGTHNTYTVDLSFLDKSEFFTIIRGQAIASGKPREFLLFPKLELPEEVRIDLVYACNFCGPSLYDNADVRADKTKAIDPITAKIRNCFNQVRELEKILGSDDEDIQQLKSVYFYGYASNRGSHDPYMIPGADRIGCTTSVHGDGSLQNPKRKNTMWDRGFVELGDCNKALSEDRNLYIMDRVIKNLSAEFGIAVSKEHDYSALRGFSNTLPIGTGVIDDGHRYKRDNTYRLIKQPEATGEEFEFISYPCGSLGAIADYKANPKSEQAKNDRLVLITPINEGQDYCESRMTCEKADQKMTAIENSIKAKLKNRGIGIAAVSSRSRSNEMAFITATQSDADFLSQEEIAEVMRTESVDPNANPQA